MITTRQRQFLSPILEWNTIPAATLVYFAEQLQRRLFSVILDAFKRRVKERGLTQKQLAKRIHRSPVTVNRWLSSPSNLTIESVAILMVGLAMEFDEFPFTPIEKTLKTAEQEQRRKEEEANVKQALDKIEQNVRAMLVAQMPQIIESLKESEAPSGVSITPMASSPTGATQTSKLPSTSRGSERRAQSHIRRLVGERYA